MSTTEAIRLQLRSWPEVEAYLGRCKGVIVPLGSTEQHGPTGAIGTDALTAEAVALEVGRRSGVLVTPAQAFGMAEHHLGFAGTVSLQPSTLLAVLRDVVLSLATHGFERVFVINGHGGNIATGRAAFAEAYGEARRRQLPVASKLQCRMANWFMAGPVMQEARSLYGDREGHHATPSEIALTLHLEPSLQDLQRPLPEPAPRARSTAPMISAGATPTDAWARTLTSPRPITANASWISLPRRSARIWSSFWPATPHEPHLRRRRAQGGPTGAA